MTYDQITSLLDRGFTPDQITSLARADPMPQEPEPQEPEPQEPEPQEPEPEQNQFEQIRMELDSLKEPEPEQNQFEQIRMELDSLKQSIQKNNVLTKSFEKMDESNTVEDILAGFIRPPMNGGKK